MPYSHESAADAVALQPVLASELNAWTSRRTSSEQTWLKSAGFKAGAGSWCGLAGENGGIESVVFGMSKEGWLGQLARLATSLPAGRYQLVSDWTIDQRRQAALGWGLAQYRFDRYKKDKRDLPTLVLDADIAEDVEVLCAAQCLVRDLVNTPTDDLGPKQLVDALVSEADRFGAHCKVISGDHLLDENFPAIHAVGRAADEVPRLVTMEWGDAAHPLLVLAGKGVVFDSGGLDIKPARGMALMKKDMGGAAHVIALASLVMHYQLPVRLMVIIPAVENAIAGNAYRPGDVVQTRKGLTIEIGNTDAEGRVVLADALALGCEQDPDLVFDFATLTGAARVAMGPDVPPIFSNRPEIARGLMDAGLAVEDPLWELPLYRPYRKLIESDIADLNNSGKSALGGCITAALFLQAFVKPDIPWVHFDTFAWNPTHRPGRPAGGEALGLRAAFRYLARRYAKAE